MSNKMLIVLQHEFRQKLRSRAYLILTFTGPLLFALLFAVPALFQTLNTNDVARIAVVDSTGRIAAHLLLPDSSVKKENVSFVSVQNVSEDSLHARVRRGELAGVLVIGPNAIQERQVETSQLRMRNVNDLSTSREIEERYKNAVREERFKDQGLNASQVQAMEEVPDLSTLKVNETGRDAQDSGGTYIAGYITGFIIYMALLLYGTMIMRSVIEEKGSRIVEVIVSSISPFDLLLGKVLGNALAAFLQVAVWAIILALVAVLGVPALLMATGGSFHLGFSPYLFIYFVVYFVLGFLIFATLYAAVGATVDQETDAQQASMPITLLVVVPILALSSVIQSPSSTTSVLLSLIPFFTPVLMMGRIFSETPPAWQIALSFALMGLTFLGVLWVTARIYRVGILMYGKRFSFKEAAKWLRYSN